MTFEKLYSMKIRLFVFLSGEPGLVDRVFALQAGSRGFDTHPRHMSERFFRSNRPGYPHPVSSELENSGIRVAVGDCSVTKRRHWPICAYARKTLQTQRGRTRGAGCLRQWFRTAEPLGERRYENWNTHRHAYVCFSVCSEIFAEEEQIFQQCPILFTCWQV